MSTNEFPVSVRFPVVWGEMDAYGHVNNARFFTWFESARIEYLTRAGIWSQTEPQGVSVILARATCDYLVPVRFPAELVAHARVARIGTSSMLMEYAVDDVKTGVRHGKGEGVVVTLEYPAYTKVPVPAHVREAVASIEGRAL